MKESYREDDAHHSGPESCLDDPRGRGEALTGESTGGLLSSEITSSRMPTRWCAGQGNISGNDPTRVTTGFGGVTEPGMCGRSLCENGEISAGSNQTESDSRLDSMGKVNSRTLMERTVEKSDGVIIPQTPANNGTAVPAESVEDKVVQQACVTILNEVFEPLFIGFSYGYRPGRSQHDALDALHEGIMRRKINWILENGFGRILP